MFTNRLRLAVALLFGVIAGGLVTHRLLDTGGTLAPPQCGAPRATPDLLLGRPVSTRGRFLSLDGEEVPLLAARPGGAVLVRVADASVDSALILRSVLVAQRPAQSGASSQVVIVGTIRDFPRAWLDSVLSNLRYGHDGDPSEGWLKRVRVVTASESDLRALGLVGPASWMRISDRGELLARGEGPF